MIIINQLIISLQKSTYIQNSFTIDKHDSGYLGMAVQLCVQAHLGHYYIFVLEGLQPKTDGTTEVQYARHISSVDFKLASGGPGAGGLIGCVSTV